MALTKTYRAKYLKFLVGSGLLLAANAPRAELPGRFFFTPQERAALDAQRNKGIGIGLAAGGNAITVNGMVTRSSGKSTIWINGSPQNEAETPGGITVIGKQPAGGKLTVRLPDSSKPVDMRVGQTLETGSGQIREAYEAKPRQEKEGNAGP